MSLWTAHKGYYTTSVYRNIKHSQKSVMVNNSTYLLKIENSFINSLTSEKKSPTHLAVIKQIISGKPNVILPVASTNIIVKLIVILVIPPNCDAATINE